MTLKFRPHHFLCTLSFQGKGYSKSFVDNFQTIFDKLNAPGGDGISIEVVGTTDDICKPCPYKIQVGKRQNLCVTQEKIDELDQRHAGALGIKTGDCLTWGYAKQLIGQQITEEKFQLICQGCEWQQSGICLSALRKLQQTNDKN